MFSLGSHNHIVVSVKDADRGGRLTHLLIIDGQPIWPLFRYFQARNMDFLTEADYARSMGMLADFVAAKGTEFLDQDRRPLLFVAFAQAVLTGTIRDGDDPSGLWWHPRTRQRAKRLVSTACEASDWLAEVCGAVPLNPFDRKASSAERLAFWRHWNTARAASLLGHAKSVQQAAGAATSARRFDTWNKKPKFEGLPPSFPEEKIDELLFEGLAVLGHQADERPWVRWNLRDQMIVLLMHFGGLRVSEPMHLWADDVFATSREPDLARVLIHHPSEGLCECVNPATGAPVRLTRAEYLRTYCDRVPLVDGVGRGRAGWKGPMLTNRDRKAFEVFWFPKSAGELFLRLYRMYIERVRPASTPHPYLFLTRDGQPLGAASFAKIHARAVARIGLSVSKGLGTTPHGHRHAYGQRLATSGLLTKEIQIAMHHASPLSQAVYTEPDFEEISKRMNEAEAKLALSVPELPRLRHDGGA